tara:strand:+ start:1055 stop:1330 length:276 start_codon:yes stop_codon:yes gene_type:complete
MYLNKNYFYRRLTDLKQRLRLTDGGVMASNKYLIKMMFRGFSNLQINDLVREQFTYFDVPSYWESHKSLRLREKITYKPKYKQLMMGNICQ